jgi:hypothetical protein
MDVFLQAAIDEARKGLAEGDISIGSVLVLDGKHRARPQPARAVYTVRQRRFRPLCLRTPGCLDCRRSAT